MKSTKTKKIKKSFQCFLCGESIIGKKTLIYTFKDNKFPDKNARNEWIPYDYNSFNFLIEKFNMKMKISMCSGAENIDYNRKHEYSLNDITIFCFSLVNEFSFKKIKDEYYREFVECSIKKPYILVGLKSDKRDMNLKNNEGRENIIKYSCDDNDIITTEMGEQLKEEIGASAYIECSSLNFINVHEVFEEAAHAVLQASTDENANNEKINDDLCCSIF